VCVDMCVHTDLCFLIDVATVRANKQAWLIRMLTATISGACANREL